MKTTFIGSPNYDKNRKPIDRVVIHWFGMGKMAGVDATFQRPGGTSAHYAIENTTVHQYVLEQNVAYHAGNYAMNQRSIGIEHSAEPTRPASESTYITSGKLVAEICNKYNIPLDRKHIIGHKEVKATQCPGTMDIDKIISLAKGEPTTPPMNDERPYWFDLINKVVWNKPHEQLTLDMIKGFVKDYPSQYKRSGEYDKFVQYIKNDPNIDTNSVSAQDLINIVGGLRGDAKRAREEAEVAKQEVANRVEQISRLDKQLLDTQKLLAEASKSNLPYLDRIKILEGNVDTLSKEKGVLMLDLTKCQTGQETAKKNLIQRITDFINSIWK